jgi:endonuclease/exonuclease/phosphatase family metal-dependent hydrolase
MDTSTSIRVVSFNIRYGFAEDGLNSWPHRASAVLDLLKSTKADWIALQEALNFQLDYLQHHLGGWPRLGVGRDDGAGGGEHCALLFRPDRWEWRRNGTFWLSETPYLPGSRSWGASLPRICTWASLGLRQSAAEFYLFNTHLDYESAQARSQSVDLIAQELFRLSKPVVLTGDFNASPKELVGLCQNPKKPMQFVWERLRVPAPGTFHGFQGDLDGPSIDHILVSPEFSVSRVSVLTQKYQNRWPSDHFAVVADLEF